MGSLTRARHATRAVILGLSFAAGRPAGAQGGAPEVSVEAASGVDPVALRKHLQVELAGVRAPGKVEIARAGASVRVRLTFPDGTEEREVALRDVAPSEIPRVLSLVVAEAARAHPARPEAPPEPARSELAPAPAPAPPPASPPRVAPPSSSSARAAFGAEAFLGLRAFRAAEDLALEPRLSGFVRLASGLRFDAGAFYLTSSETDPLGRVTLQGFGGSVAGSLERALGTSFAVRLGPRLDVGSASGRGISSGVAIEGRAGGPLALLVAELVARYRLGRLSLLLAGDAGGVLSGIGLGADARTPLAWTGATFGGRLGLGFE